MNLNNKKAFSLTELLIVLVIVAVLFAAALPILTKRSVNISNADEQVWSYVSQDDQKDAFYDAGVRAYTTTAYVGLDAVELVDAKPYSKVVLRAKKNQNMIQFRYGEGIGTLSGLFAIDDNGNIVASGKLPGTAASNYMITGSNNTVAGMGAFSSATNRKNDVAIGSNTLTVANSSASYADNLAIGVNSGIYSKNTNNNVFVGANTNKVTESFNTVGVGANVVGSGSGGTATGGGNENVFAGYFVGNVGFTGGTNSQKNTVLGSKYYATNASNNTIVGYDTFSGGKITAQNITAVGPNSCLSMQLPYSNNSNPGRRTCIGYDSAKTRGDQINKSPDSFEKDSYDHIFIGGTPAGAFGGRAVLEVHNINTTPSLAAKPKLGPSVVLNSNLVVRGNLYIPDAEKGRLTPITPSLVLPETFYSMENGADRCGRKCIARRRRGWYAKDRCAALGAILGAIVGALTMAVLILTNVIAPGVAGGIYLVLWGAGFGGSIGSIFNGSKYKRAVDPPSYTTLSFMPDKYSCGAADKQYPNGTYCPNLQLSDMRLKSVKSLNTEALEKIMLTVPYNYTYKFDKEATPQVGVIAQDLQKYFPDSVTEDKDGYLNIRWDEMFFATINSVKSLTSEIANLGDDVYILELDAKNVTKEQKNIKDRINKINKKLDKLED